MSVEEQAVYETVYREFLRREEGVEGEEERRGLAREKGERVRGIVRCRVLREARDVVGRLKKRSVESRDRNEVAVTASADTAEASAGDLAPREVAGAQAEDASVPPQVKEAVLSTEPTHASFLTAPQDRSKPASPSTAAANTQLSDPAPSPVSNTSLPPGVDDTTDVEDEGEAVDTKLAKVKNVDVDMDWEEISELLEGFRKEK